jgi:hypothetical protein
VPLIDTSVTEWLPVAGAELLGLAVGAAEAGADDAGAAGLADTVSSGSGWNGSRVLSARIAGAGATVALAFGVGVTFGVTAVECDGVTVGAAFVLLELLFLKTRK